MRFVCVLLLVLTTVLAYKINPFDKVRRKFELLDDQTKKYICDLCTETAIATEEYIGAEGGTGWEKVVTQCTTAVSKGTPLGFAEFLCDTLVGDIIRPIIKQLNDPDFRNKEAAKACGQIMGCSSV